MEKVLDVNNLRISFRTNNGTVKAVRDISFSLNKGETLAIVGESGSGKSVTSRAIMGILAGNAIVESGEMFYDGKDLMKISEDDFHQLRGNRIAMIFQDPFSSLNPIVRVGKQLTEAMILNGKASQRDARRDLNAKMKLLTVNVKQALEKDPKSASRAAETSRTMAKVRRFTTKGNALEKVYNAAREGVETTITAIEGALIDIINGEPKVIVREINEIFKGARKCYHQYLFEDNGALPPLIAKLDGALKKYLKDGDRNEVAAQLREIRALYDVALELPKPDFFAMGYYITYNPQADIKTNDIDGLNKRMRDYMHSEFMGSFLKDLAAGIRLSHSRSLVNKKRALDVINARLPMFDNDNISEAQCKEVAKELSRAVEASIDRLSIVKDSFGYTFRSGLNSALEAYLEMRNLQSKSHLSKANTVIADGADIAVYRENIRTILLRIRDSYQNELSGASQVNFDELALGMMDYIKTKSSQVVYRVTKSMAKSRAISLMEEVGIPDARDRYVQYPFQFSGGMRQRVVIAIALAANPDILICDEPSTALDVTIQAQILDLLNGLKEKRRLSVIFITHDLGVVANMADHIAVMYAGKIVEVGTVDEVFYEPAHPYTWALLASMPDLETKEKLEAIVGTPPNMIKPPKGDAFAARNKYAMKIDFEEEPPFFELSPTHKAATWLLHRDAPKVEPPKIVVDRIRRMRRMEGQDDE